jgi:putative ABC transport system permease protein
MHIRAWLDETHGASVELVRHFLANIFDSDMFGVPGEWQKVAAGILAALLSLGILALPTFIQSFDKMREAGLSSLGIYSEMRAYELTFIGIAIGLTALLTALVWQSLFPSLRDCLALAALPLSARQIFVAKSGALLLAFAAFVLALNLPWALMFAAASSGGLQQSPSALAQVAANFCATGSACVFAFFSLLACQGILLNVLPTRLFTRASLFVQSAVFVATLGLLPFIGRQPDTAAWWPPVWFLGLWEAILQGSWNSGRDAVVAIALPVVISVLAYLMSYHRYRRVLLEGRPATASNRKTGVGSWLLECWIGDPRQQAAFAFIWKTLARSRSHRLILLAYGGIALGVITKSALDMPRPSLRNEGMYGLVVVLAPLAVAMLVTIGLRYLFRLPESLPANWIFRTVDGDGRAAWLAAVERFVVCCGIAPVFLIALPAAIGILGWLRAAAATLLAFFAALLWFEYLFRRWQKLPFTCSYLPGQKPVWLTLSQYALATPFLGSLGSLILYSSGEITAFVALSTFEGAVWWKLRSARRKVWSACPLSYEEVAEAAVMSLDLQPTNVMQSEPIAAGPQMEAPLFSSASSRGLLPQEWVEEIKSERRSGWTLLETCIEDVRYALRLIRRNPLLSAVIVLTLTVGIGINASVFTMVNGLALRPHVYKDPDRFVRVIPTSRLQGRQRQVSYAEYVAWRDHSRSLRQLAAFHFFGALVGDDDFTEAEGVAVSCNFFSVDGLDHATLGRLIGADDCNAKGQIPVAVISESLWRSRFGADPRAINRVAQINYRPAIVIGVVPDVTAGWARPEHFSRSVWMPYTALSYFDPSRDLFSREEFLWLWLAGRLAPGFSRSDARTELNVLADQQDHLHAGRRTAVVTNDGSWAAQLELTASSKGLMLMGFFFGTFNLVLFISCANVATMMLSRAAARKREIAVRLSLGAPRIRLVRMLVTESLLLAALAGAASVYLAWRVPGPLLRLVATRAADFPMPPDWRTFAYISAVVLVTGILAGLAPALESLKVDLTASLKGSGGLILGPTGGTRLRGLLVCLQVALSMVLLVEAGLFARSEQRAIRGNPGYAPQRVVVAYLSFPDKSTLESTRARLHAIVQRVKALPGVRSVTFSDDLPLFFPDTVELRPPARRDASQPVDVYTASPDFFETLGIPIVRGREFQELDAAAVVISQSLAKAFWPRQDPIGKMLALPTGAAPVVGVASDIEPMRIGGSENPPVYHVRHVDAHRNVMSVRFDAGAAMGAPAIRVALHQLDPNLVVAPFFLQRWIDRITADLWNVVALMVVLGVVGTVLATTGIYGAVSFAVSQKTKDLGVRVALGATRWDIIREVIVSGGKPVLQGLIAGLWMSVAAAAGLRESVNGPLMRIDASEPLLYCGAALMLGAAAVLAMLGPARRGASSDPLDALRCE